METWIMVARAIQKWEKNFPKVSVDSIDKIDKSLIVLDDELLQTFPVGFAPNDIIYASIITPAIHYTMGGLKINRNVI